MAGNNRLVESVEVTDDKVHIIHLKSVFDASTVDEFEHVLQYLMTNHCYRFVIDLSHVEFISSAGWGNFVGELQDIRKNDGDIKLAGMCQEVYDVYLLLELDSFIKAYESIDDALLDFAENKIGVDHENLNEKFAEREAAGAAPEIGTASVAASRSDSGRRQKRASAHSETVLEKELQKLEGQPAARHTGKRAARPQPPPSGSGSPSQPPERGHRQQRMENDKKPPAKRAPVLDSQPAVDFHLSKAVAAGRSAPRHGAYPARPANGADPAPRAEVAKTAQAAANGRKAYAYDPGEDYADTSTVTLTDLRSDPLLEKIISVVIAYPSYGPSAIRKMLLNMSMADESLTRSMVYRKLVEVDLSTRAKRIAFARANTI